MRRRESVAAATAPERERRSKMGDKSPKAARRQANQNQAKSDAAAKQKQKAMSAKQVPKKG
jgi:hypothetical protein